MSCHSDEQKSYLENKQEILRRFGPGWLEKMKYSALANNAFHALMRSNDPYLLIGQLIEIIEKQNESMFKIISQNPTLKF